MLCGDRGKHFEATDIVTVMLQRHHHKRAHPDPLASVAIHTAVRFAIEAVNDVSQQHCEPVRLCVRGRR